MPSQRRREIEDPYLAALDRAPSARPALLEAADPELRREVESLLAQQASKTGLLDRPAWEVADRLTAIRPAAAMAPGTQLRPYQIEAPIGNGGMGQVYRACDPRLGSDVAIKVSEERFSERFSRSPQALFSTTRPLGTNHFLLHAFEGRTTGPDGRPFCSGQCAAADHGGAELAVRAEEIVQGEP
jgi:hypothetical protein